MRYRICSERMGNSGSAATEDAGVHCKEVPRMLWEKKDKTRLEECDAPAAPFHPSV